MKNVFRILLLLALLLATLFYVTAPEMSLGEVWSKYNFTTLQLIQPAIERYISPKLWDPFFINLLLNKFWKVMLAFGALSYVLSRLCKD